MPNIKSAKKRVQVEKVKNLRNQIQKSHLKTSSKKFETILASGDKAEVSAAFSSAVSTIDKAVAKGLIHKNTAARKKSVLAQKLNALS